MSVGILQGDCLKTLPTLASESVHCVVTSPPYWGLRDYGLPGSDWPKMKFIPMAGLPPVRLPAWSGCLGLEPDPLAFVGHVVAVFRQVRRVLRNDGTLFLNFGDSYFGSVRGNTPTATPAGDLIVSGASHRDVRQCDTSCSASLKSKDLCGIPWRVALALQADGWYLRSDIIWHKPNPMPESCTDRPTKAHEYFFLLTKAERYFYDAEAIRESAGGWNGSEFHDGKNAIVHPNVGKNRKRPAGWVNEGSHHELVGRYPKNSKSFRGGGAYTNGAAFDNSEGKERETHGNHPNLSGTHNKRSVWTVATAPFNDWTDTPHWERVVEDARGDGIRCTVSLDSPADGGLFDLLATALCDEHGDDLDAHTSGMCSRLSKEPRDGYAPIDRLHAYRWQGQSLDLLLRKHFSSANGHSNETHKTDLYVATNLSCKPSAERTSHIRRTLAKHGLSEPYLDMIENNTWPDEMDVRLWEEILFHNSDKSSDSCGASYRERREKTSHFATFPPDLIRPCILAGTSERGACASCGAPWERVVEKGAPDLEHQRACGGDVAGEYHGEAVKEYNGTGAQNASEVKARILEGMRSRRTVDWKPSCNCEKPKTVPCTVLDPFGGSGTTAAVAIEHGRRAVLCEMKQDYVELIHARLDKTQPGLF